ncbi:MAG: L,D-transpeptidase [Bosea sp.]|uniref:L,D-transpeptidase n=1 Tax=Bosea sp. (in: a-proteobacteria) TaxID=1871050 RepID=UPI001AD57347|nr:L,D-transpeptidase [Bosea sp. (in: a-proteobacteria)]MBN9470677.1 L,D-transpeptidase [Bosea sp. (in: a-proteobacteria)]
MSRLLGILAFIFAALAGLGTAQAGVNVRIDLAAQRMTVKTSDGEVHNWAISSGRKGFRSPNGVYRPTRLERSWYSRKYGGAMPHSVFFRGGYAIHGTTAVGALGRPASHGCIRLHPANAAKLFALVKKHGAGATRIALNGAVTDNYSRFASASGGSKVAKAKLKSSKSQVVRAKAKAEKAQFAARQRKAPGWGEAREQILLRPGLPPGAYGYQPYGGGGYGGSGWR